MRLVSLAFERLREELVRTRGSEESAFTIEALATDRVRSVGYPSPSERSYVLARAGSCSAPSLWPPLPLASKVRQPALVRPMQP